MRRFSKSFQRKYHKLKPGETCMLKHHYSGALRELVGLLDLWAANDPERFIPLDGGVDAIVRCCHRYKGAGYGKRAIEYALREVRERHIISDWLVRIRDGEEVSGFIMAPHDCLSVRESDTTCIFKGQLRAPGYWKRDVLKTASGEVKLGPVYWAGFPGVLREEISRFPSGQQTLAAKSLDAAGEKCAANCAVENSNCAVDCAVDCAVENSTQPSEGIEVKPDFSPNRVSRVSRGQSAVEIENLTTPVNPMNESTAMVAEEKPLVGRMVEEKATADDQSKNIQRHFGGQRGAVLLTIEEISAGTMIAEIWDEKVDYEAQRELLKLCGEIIMEFGTQPYLGLQTHGRIMDVAGQRYNAMGKKYPPCWLKVLKDLKRSGNRPLETLGAKSNG
jgi:hypothetical protein